MCADAFTPWLTATLASAACLSCLALWSHGKRARRRAAVAELRLRRTRVRLRAAEAELREADEYLSATGELLEHYEETFGPLPLNPFARDAAQCPAAGAVDAWPEELSGADLKGDA